MSLPYLVSRNGHFYFRAWIPIDIRIHFNRKEIWKSLKTTYLKHAKTLAKDLAARADKLFMVIRTGILTDDQIKTLVRQFVNNELQRYEDRKNGVGLSTEVLAQIEEVESVATPELLVLLGEGNKPNSYEELKTKLQCKLSYNLLGVVKEEVANIISSEGLQIGIPSPEYYNLCREILKGKIAVAGILAKRSEGDYFSEEEKLIQHWNAENSSKVPEAPEVSTVPTIEEPAYKKLSEIIVMYIDNKKMSNKYRNRVTRALTRFLSFVGDTDCNKIKAPDIDKFINSLPTKLKDSTKHDYLKQIHALLSWATNKEYVDRNRAAGADIPCNGNKSEKRPAYDKNDIAVLCKGLITECTKALSRTHPERFWIPLIALYTGMRLNEICQLYVTDVKELDSIWYFDINEEDDKVIDKSDSCLRLVPIHPDLINLGLLEYAKVISSGSKRLWPKLTYTVTNYYSGAFGQWYRLNVNNRYVRANDTINLNKVFHSFRHTASNALKQSNPGLETVCEEIIGHSVGTKIARGYTEAYGVKTKYDVLVKLNYNIDLSLLRDTWNTLKR